jgi:hypothetical protein
MQAFHGGKTIQKNHLERRRFNLTTVMKVMYDEETQKTETTGGQEFVRCGYGFLRYPIMPSTALVKIAFDSVMRVVVEQ